MDLHTKSIGTFIQYNILFIMYCNHFSLSVLTSEFHIKCYKMNVLHSFYVFSFIY